MNQPIERELKVLINKTQYKKIGKSYDFSDGYTQTNTYFDTNDSYLKEHKGALRIRSKENKKILTLKIKTDAITHIELEKEINVDTIDQIDDPEILSWFEQYHIPKDVIPIASLTTFRKEYETEYATICLDYTTFNNTSDYELEYEYKKEHDGITQFNNLLKPYEITYEKNCPSKLARAIQSL